MITKLCDPLYPFRIWCLPDKELDKNKEVPKPTETQPTETQPTEKQADVLTLEALDIDMSDFSFEIELEAYLPLEVLDLG